MEDCLTSSFHFIFPQGYRPEHWENTNPERIDPYEGSAVSNYPGGTNIFYIPSDIYYTGKALVESVKHGDNEEILDASTRLFGIPANIISTGGTIATYGKLLGIVGHLPWYLTPITIIAGLILCIVEGLVDIYSLVRQKLFESEFDFDFLSNLRTIVVDGDPSKTMDAIKEITQMINEDSSAFQELIGKEQAEVVKKLLNEIHHKAKENPELVPTIVSHYRPALEEVAKELLIGNLEKIKHEFLIITEYEKEQIEQQVCQENPGLEEKELLRLQQKELQIASTIKKKQLARRVRPWMVEEANKTINPLLKGMVEGETEAIHEGLKFVDDMHTQSKKKKLAHILGIIAIIVAAASLIALAVTCPASIPYILAGVAMTFALARAGVFAGTLESRGWTFEPKKILPDWLRKRIFSDPGPDVPEIKHKYQRVLVPEEQREWIEVLHKRQLDLEKQGFESFKNQEVTPPDLARKLFV